MKIVMLPEPGDRLEFRRAVDVFAEDHDDVMRVQAGQVATVTHVKIYEIGLRLSSPDTAVSFSVDESPLKTDVQTFSELLVAISKHFRCLSRGRR